MNFHAVCAVCLLALLSAPGLANASDREEAQKLADHYKFESIAEKATVEKCIENNKSQYSITLDITDAWNTGPNILRVHDKSGDAFKTNAHSTTTFFIQDDIIYISIYNQIATGCEVIAFDLSAKKQLWKTALKGLGPIGHSKYRNRVLLGREGRFIRIIGHEAFGSYIEYISMDKGELLANRADKNIIFDWHEKLLKLDR